MSMKKGKLAFLIVFIGFFATLFLQNKEFFMMEKEIGINLWVAAYQAPPVFVLFIVLAFFLIGLLTGFFSSLPKLIRFKREIKSLTADLKTQRDKLASIGKTMASDEKEPKPESVEKTKALPEETASKETASEETVPEETAKDA
jgi:hypothetical protein